MARFEIHPIDRFADKSAAIKRPREITCFSYDSEHRLRLDDSSLSYYWPPSLPADLSAGFDTFDKHDDSGDEHLDSLLKAIEELEKTENSRREVDIVTWRGMMTKIMTAPFDKFSEFEMNAKLFQGTIYIEDDNETKVKCREEQFSQPKRHRGLSQEMMMYWGYKFEALSLIPDQWDAVTRDFIETRPSHPVSNKAQYCSIAQTGFGNTSLILGGEVDAVWDRKPDDPSQPINWVELKTAEEPQSDHDMLKFERKLLKFWAQSFLLGVPKIIVGFRDKGGMLRRLEHLETQKLPGMVKRVGRQSWDGNLCINFTAAFLDFLKQSITSEGIYRIRRRKNTPFIEVIKQSDTGHGNILTSSFIEWRTQRVADETSNFVASLGANAESGSPPSTTS